MKVIRESGLARFKHGVKVVGGMTTKKMESLPYALNLEVSHASEGTCPLAISILVFMFVCICNQVFFVGEC